MALLRITYIKDITTEKSKLDVNTDAAKLFKYGLDLVLDVVLSSTFGMKTEDEEQTYADVFHIFTLPHAPERYINE